MMTKEEAKEKIKHLVEEFSEYTKEELDKKSEFQIQSEFIDPLFEALGWDMRKDAEREKRIFGKRADYIMHLGNQEVAIIEAKKTNIQLADEKEGEQAVSYAYHQKIKFAVLTNFKQIRIYHALNHTIRIDRNLLKDNAGNLWINCEDFVKEFDRLWFLSKESFENGEINKLLENVNKRLIKPIDDSILQDLLEIRRILSNDLKNKRTYLSSEQIDEAVQILIDRLIFMRSVEDRGLEANDFLLKIIKSVKEGYEDMNLWVVLKKQFRRFDATYNSKLFAEGLLEKEDIFFEQKTLIKTIDGLYYGTADHQARYKFNIIPVDLLGSIYEQYLGTILSSTEKRVKLEGKSDKRKKMGIYYTPSYIVDYIVKNTVHEYTKDKTIDEILKVKILDPACGSGSFLIKAFQELINIIEEKLKKGEKSKEYKHAFQEWKDKLSLGEKATILTNCIYGVDLDEKAVELAQLNLLLKILEEETRDTKIKKLPNLLKNVKNGNSLIDDPKVSDRAFKWQVEFKDIMNSGGFDVVVGNPPYVRVQELKYDDIDYFKTKYKSAYKRVDIAILFFEKTSELLKKGGLLGFISSNQFLVTEYGRMIRKFLLENYEIKKMVDFGDLPIFESALTYASIFILKKGSKKDFNYLKINSLNEVKQLESIKGVDIEINSLNDDGWVLTKNDESVIINKLNLIPKLNQIGSANAGIITGLDDILMFDKSEIEKMKFEKELILPIIRGTDPKRYGYTSPSKYIIYPYKIEGEKTKILSEKELKNFPIIYNYLIKQKSALVKRKDSRKTFEDRKDWFALVRFGQKEIFNQEKIVTPGEVKDHKFSLDNSNAGFSCARVFAITINNKKYNLKYILAILNSDLIKFYLRHIAPIKQGGYYTYSSTVLGQIPIRLPSPSQEKHITSLVEQMLFLQKKFHDEKIIGNEKERLKSQTDAVDYEIDEEVYKLYGITDEEKKIIEESGK